MLDRMTAGEVPPKHHVAFRSSAGKLRYEECFTREGFDGPYSILYHEHRPHALAPSSTEYRSKPLTPASVGNRSLARRHFRTSALPGASTPLESRLPLLFNGDVTLYAVKASESDAVYFVNSDGDELFFVRTGTGVVRSPFGDLGFTSGDYVCIPKGTPYRFVLGAERMDAFLVECHGGVGLPAKWRNAAGQLRMDAPYCHRDFRRPAFRGPMDERIRDVLVKRHGMLHGFRRAESLLDVVGWDGSVYPWAFPILAFQPRVGQVHLPPTVHGTFQAKGALISSFVPRPLDFHPDAVPCPYPHTSVDVDEVLYYVSGNFTSRNGVGEGSVTLHPAGIPHGPHPGRYEASVGARSTEEVAVMLDCDAPLTPTVHAESAEDEAYDRTF